MLLVIIVNALDRLDTRVFFGRVVALVSSLVPVENTTNEGRNEESASLSSSNSLDKGEHEGQVAVDAVLGLQDVSSLDTFPGGGNLDEDAVLGDANGLVELSLLLATMRCNL